MGFGDFLGEILPVAGAAIGTAIMPGAGTAIGGALGGLAGGAIANGQPTPDGGTQTSEYGWISPILTNALQYGLAYLSEDERAQAIEEANAKNIDLAEESNALEREKWELQKQILERQIAGVTGPDGRTYSDSAGYHTKLNPQSQALHDAIRNAETRSATEGDQRNARLESDAFGRSLEAGGEADALLREFQGIDKMEAGPLADLLYSAGQKGYNETQDGYGSAVRKASIQRGATPDSMAKQVSMRAQGDADTSAQMGMQARLDAMGYTDSKYAADRSQTADLYNVFANRAAAGSSPGASGVRGPSTSPVSAPSINANLSTPAFTATGDPFSADAEMLAGLSTMFGAQGQSAEDEAKWDALYGLLSQSGKPSTGAGSGGGFGTNDAAGTGSTGGLPWYS